MYNDCEGIDPSEDLIIELKYLIEKQLACEVIEDIVRKLHS